MAPFHILSDTPVPRGWKPRLNASRLTQAEEWAAFAEAYARDVAKRLRGKR